MVKTNRAHTTCESRASDVSQEHQTPDRQSTLPKTTCLLSSHSVLLHVTKNWHPLELGPGYMQV